MDGDLLASAYLSLVLAMRGALRQATTHADHALALGGSQGWSEEIQSTSAWLSLALVHLQRGDVFAARRALDEATVVLERRPDALLQVCRTLASARLLNETGDQGAARSALGEARAVLDALPEVPFLTDWCLIVGAELELTEGRPSAVLDLLDPTTRLGTSAAARVLRGRAFLHQGHGEEALAEVEPLTVAWRPDVAGIEAWVVIALAQESMRQDGAALIALTRALQAAESRGMGTPVPARAGAADPAAGAVPDRGDDPVPLGRPAAGAVAGPGRPARLAHRPRAGGPAAAAEHDEQRADRRASSSCR